MVLGKEKCINRKFLLPLTFHLPKKKKPPNYNEKSTNCKDQRSKIFLYPLTTKCTKGKWHLFTSLLPFNIN
jgi:hypothetical protein